MTREEQRARAAHEYIQSDSVATGNEALAFGDFINGAKWADFHPQWIPVEERLPEIPRNDWKSNNVLFVVNGEIFYGYRGKYTWHAPFVSFNNHEVTHWMPLPQPPRKEDKE